MLQESPYSQGQGQTPPSSSSTPESGEVKVRTSGTAVSPIQRTVSVESEDDVTPATSIVLASRPEPAGQRYVSDSDHSDDEVARINHWQNSEAQKHQYQNVPGDVALDPALDVALDDVPAAPVQDTETSVDADDDEDALEPGVNIYVALIASNTLPWMPKYYY